MPIARRLIPSTSELLAFEAAARHESFTRAAVELNLTQGAISRSVDMLEKRLHVQLFERVRQRIVLTDSGRAYFNEVHELLEQVSSATHRLSAIEPGGEILNLSVLPTFGTHWLIQRLPAFQAEHTKVVVNLTSRIRPFSFEHEPFDAAIHHGQASWPGAVTQHLMDETMVPMCSPGYRSAKSLRKPADLARATLIHASTRPSAWADWHEQAGLQARTAYRGPSHDQFSMVAAAAAAGMGVALLPSFLVEQQIRERKLERLFDLPLSTGSAYYVVLPETGTKPIAKTFAAWLSALLSTLR